MRINLNAVAVVLAVVTTLALLGAMIFVPLMSSGS